MVVSERMKIRIGDFQWRLRVRAWGMRTGTSITVSANDRRRLEKIVSDRNAAQKPVWRSGIVLLTARGLGTHAIMVRTKASIPVEKVAEVVRLSRSASDPCGAPFASP